MIRTAFLGMSAVALCAVTAVAQPVELPGPGGIPLAPGSRPFGWTPGGIGPGGIPVAPGPAARDVPMQRTGPGGIPLPLRPDRQPDGHLRALSLPRCAAAGCAARAAPQSLRLTISGRGTQVPHRPANPVGSVEALVRALRGCWQAPADAPSGLAVTLRLALRRSGEAMGRPFVTYTARVGTTDDRRAFRRAAEAALDLCTPLPVTAAFGNTIAGRPLSIRFVGP